MQMTKYLCPFCNTPLKFMVEVEEPEIGDHIIYHCGCKNGAWAKFGSLWKRRIDYSCDLSQNIREFVYTTIKSEVISIGL